MSIPEVHPSVWDQIEWKKQKLLEFAGYSNLITLFKGMSDSQDAEFITAGDKLKAALTAPGVAENLNTALESDEIKLKVIALSKTDAKRLGDIAVQIQNDPTHAKTILASIDQVAPQPKETAKTEQPQGPQPKLTTPAPGGTSGTTGNPVPTTPTAATQLYGKQDVRVLALQRYVIQHDATLATKLGPEQDDALLGQHTREVMSKMGFDVSMLSALPSASSVATKESIDAMFEKNQAVIAELEKKDPTLAAALRQPAAPPVTNTVSTLTAADSNNLTIIQKDADARATSIATTLGADKTADLKTLLQEVATLQSVMDKQGSSQTDSTAMQADEKEKANAIATALGADKTDGLRILLQEIADLQFAKDTNGRPTDLNQLMATLQSQGVQGFQIAQTVSPAPGPSGPSSRHVG